MTDTKPPFEKRPGLKFILDHVGHVGTECVVWPMSCCTSGYGSFGNGKKVYLAHREMCRLTHGDPPSPTHHAAHSCGNRRCVNPGHLSWKSQRENQLDRRKHGTNKAKYTKLTPQQVAQIRQLKGTETSIATAARYGVTESNIRQIQDGKIWRDVGRKIRGPISDDQVRTIRRWGPAPARVISEELGIHESTIRRVRRGDAYRHVA